MMIDRPEYWIITALFAGFVFGLLAALLVELKFNQHEE